MDSIQILLSNSTRAATAWGDNFFGQLGRGVTENKLVTDVEHMYTMSNYAVLVGGANGDGAWRSLVTIVELIDLRPYEN